MSTLRVLESYPMARLYFTGIKHSGKTLMAKLSSRILGLSAADADDLALPLLGGLTVREYYKANGKDAFNERQLEAVRDYASGHPEGVISLGGGAVEDKALMEYVKETGKLVYLRRDEREMFPFVIEHGIPAFLDPMDLEGSFHKVYQRRDELNLEAADLVIELGPYGDKQETAMKVVQALKEAGYVKLDR